MAKKQQLGYKEIEERLRIIKDNYVPAEEIGYHILYSFGKGERDIARYKEGKGILKTFEGLLIKGLFCFRKSGQVGRTVKFTICSRHSLVRTQPDDVYSRWPQYNTD